MATMKFSKRGTARIKMPAISDTIGVRPRWICMAYSSSNYCGASALSFYRICFELTKQFGARRYDSIDCRARKRFPRAAIRRELGGKELGKSAMLTARGNARANLISLSQHLCYW